jgi:hypothetical protein
MYFDIITSASGPRFPEASILFSLEALGMARLLLLALEKGNLTRSKSYDF